MRGKTGVSRKQVSVSRKHMNVSRKQVGVSMNQMGVSMQPVSRKHMSVSDPYRASGDSGNDAASCVSVCEGGGEGLRASHTHTHPSQTLTASRGGAAQSGRILHDKSFSFQKSVNEVYCTIA